MSKSVVIHARIEPQTKRMAEGVLKHLGMSPTEAIRLFYRQICLHSGMPFPVKIPNEETRAALAKRRKSEDVESFKSLDDMFASWEK